MIEDEKKQNNKQTDSSPKYPQASGSEMVQLQRYHAIFTPIAFRKVPV